MYFVTRGANGAVVGAWSTRQFDHQEPVNPNNSALIRYLNSTALGQRLAAVGLTPDDIRQLSVRGPGLYITRDADGRVVDATDAPSRDGQEMVPIDDPALQAFLATPAADDAA